MEKGNKSEKSSKAPSPDFGLQWGNRKRIRCGRAKDPKVSLKFNSGSGIRKKFTLFSSDKENSQVQSNRFTRNSEGATLRSLVNHSLTLNENRKSPSSEREDRFYTRRGSVGCVDESGKVSMDVNGNGGEDSGFVWPKLYIALSSKEKEEDFLAMKGCKPPQRPKKRAKIIQRTLLLVSPGAWLTDMSQERYEVREKKSAKKRPRGLKTMGCIDSDSE